MQPRPLPRSHVTTEIETNNRRARRVFACAVHAVHGTGIAKIVPDKGRSVTHSKPIQWRGCLVWTKDYFDSALRQGDGNGMGVGGVVDAWRGGVAGAYAQ